MLHGLGLIKNVIAIPHRRASDCIGIGMAELLVILARCYQAQTVTTNTAPIDTASMLEIPNSHLALMDKLRLTTTILLPVG
jgi:hypothetical protein